LLPLLERAFPENSCRVAFGDSPIVAYLILILILFRLIRCVC
jgi:hypothetical protein